MESLVWDRAKVSALTLLIYNFEPPKRQPAKFQGFCEIYVESN